MQSELRSVDEVIVTRKQVMLSRITVMQQLLSPIPIVPGSEKSIPEGQRSEDIARIALDNAGYRIDCAGEIHLDYHWKILQGQLNDCLRDSAKLSWVRSIFDLLEL